MKKLAAAHAGDLRYVFGTYDHGRSYGGGAVPAGVGDPALLEESDRRLSEAIRSYWVSFAATGNPNTPPLPLWPAVRRWWRAPVCADRVSTCWRSSSWKSRRVSREL